MPRPLWTGSLNFGLVNVPVRLTSAVRDLDLHFRQLHAKDHIPIETRRVCSKEDKELDYEEVGNAYDLDGEQVDPDRRGAQRRRPEEDAHDRDRVVRARSTRSTRSTTTTPTT